MKIFPSSKPQRVPVIMLHSVGAAHLDWPYAYLSEDVALFERKVDDLVRQGYHFILHEDLYQYMAHGVYLPPKALMLTFDDGYLDNWTVVFPLLRRRGVRFTIYVSRDFVDPAPECRHTLEDVRDGHIPLRELPLLGYLSWAEMRAMEATGLVDIQSHTATHTWHFTENRIIDYLNPLNAGKYPWMFWNNAPADKYRWMTSAPDERLWGLPVYANRRAMVARRYIEDQELNAQLREYVGQQGGAVFFANPAWRLLIQEEVDKYHKGHELLGRHESENEYRDRMADELAANKAAIERALGKEVQYLCWPGGAYDDELIDLASQHGYRASTVKRGSNTHGDDPRFVHRIPSGNPLGAQRFPWKYPLFTLNYYIARFQHRPWARVLDALYRVRAGAAS